MTAPELLTVKIDPCSGEVTVKAETEETISQEAKREATGFNDVGPSEKSLRDRVKDQLKSDLDKKFEQEQSRLQTKATEELEKHLQDLQPEISEVVNQVTRDALKQKAQQMGTVKEVSEDAESGSLTIKAIINSSGAISGNAAGDDLVLVGDVDVDGDFLVDTAGGGMAVHVYEQIAKRDGLLAGAPSVEGLWSVTRHSIPSYPSSRNTSTACSGVKSGKPTVKIANCMSTPFACAII